MTKSNTVYQSPAANLALIGQKFNKWTVLAYIHTYRGKHFWQCVCECGTKRKVCQDGLIGKNASQSCGCVQRETASKTHRSHGFSQHPLFQTWYAMIARCYHPQAFGYKHYGGRGISVCDRWRFGQSREHGFKCFLDDMGDKPSSEYTLERKNNDKGYTPDNCKWATPNEQINNRSIPTKEIVFNGKIQTIREWSRELGVPLETLRTRIGRGWSDHDALATPLNQRRKYSQ